MSKALVGFFERHGLPPSGRRCRKLVVLWLLWTSCGMAVLILLLLLLNPQSSRFAYILQAMFTSHDGSQPWGAVGPMAQ